MVNESEARVVPGFWIALLLLLGLLGDAALYVAGGRSANAAAIVAATFLVTLVSLLATGFVIVGPNEAKVLQLFGRYVGSVKRAGLCWANPLCTARRVSLRAISFESGRIKVNDLDGNPIELAAIVVWRVVETAHACFDVDDYLQYVKVQTEGALRSLATTYPYDAHDDTKVSLRGHTPAIAEDLKREVQARASRAGVEVLDARISHLAYAPEIAQAMLQRQQANAIIAARQKIVDGAVGMVELALDRLARDNVVTLDEDRKAAMVANLLVVLCGERSTQPIVNAGVAC